MQEPTFSFLILATIQYLIDFSTSGEVKRLKTGFQKVVSKFTFKNV